MLSCKHLPKITKRRLTDGHSKKPPPLLLLLQLTRLIFGRFLLLMRNLKFQYLPYPLRQ